MDYPSAPAAEHVTAPERPPLPRPDRALVICATQRSGSTLLCELLKDTGVAGRPEEYFEARKETGLPPHPGDYLDGLPRTGVGIRDDDTPPEAPEYSSLVGLDSYVDHLERTLRLGTTPNRVFSTKLMWRQLPELCALAADVPGLPASDAVALLQSLLGAPRWVWVTRSDKVRQAVSLWRALQTRAWRADHDGRAPADENLRYSAEGIAHLVRRLEEEDGAWGAFFAERGIDVLRVVYERDLAGEVDATIRRVLAHAGVEPPEGWRAEPRLQRQADELSEAWVRLYHRDVGST